MVGGHNRFKTKFRHNELVINKAADFVNVFFAVLINAALVKIFLHKFASDLVNVFQKSSRNEEFVKGTY